MARRLLPAPSRSALSGFTNPCSSSCRGRELASSQFSFGTAISLSWATCGFVRGADSPLLHCRFASVDQEDSIPFGGGGMELAKPGAPEKPKPKKGKGEVQKVKADVAAKWEKPKLPRKGPKAGGG
eukprot:CAMPEP_0117523754 /NCGR_PEP_ID=MMETSP0784-20121206/34891_1 /TAXON_ID=39447 /ORGANISM="" /LENGTH=125 /DNA_ID=CAMNT_0005319877 /DNA_START=30 /DNA_END=407 /DNA_ORIENTATION=-